MQHSIPTGPKITAGPTEAHQKPMKSRPKTGHQLVRTQTPRLTRGRDRKAEEWRGTNGQTISGGVSKKSPGAHEGRRQEYVRLHATVLR